MYQLTLQSCLSFLLSTLFLISSTCNSGGHTKLTPSTIEATAVDENRLPTRRAFRRILRKADSLTLVYPANKTSERFYQTRIAAMNKNERFDMYVKGVKETELTETHLKKEILMIIGNVSNNPLLDKLQQDLPVVLSPNSFVFDKKEYATKDAIFKLFPYPNPYNQSLPMYLLTGNDNQQIEQFLMDYYPENLPRMMWSSFGYKVHQAGEMKVAGNLNEQTWALDKKVHFDFTGKNDTLLQTKHFQFIAHSSPLPKADVTQIAEKCEATYAEIVDFLGKPIQLPKIDYHFYPSIEAKGLQKSSMEEATAKYEEHSIEVVMNDNFKGSSHHAENKLVFRKALGEPKLLALEEGLANHFTKIWQKKGYQYWTNKLFQSDNLPPLKELLDNDFYQKESYLVMGAMAGSFTDFLIAHFGKTTFLKNYANWQRTDLEKLDKEWLAYLKETVQPIAENTKQKLPYLKGFNFAHEGYRVYNGYGSQLAKESLQRQHEIGSNAIAIVPYSYMRDPKKPDPIPIIQSTGGENDQAVLFSHYEAKKMGMSTMLKPQIWVGRSWPGDIEMKNEKDWATFFENYYRWTRHYALLAEINELDSYCIGVEFAKATLAKEKEWRKLIKKLRGIYSGQLTYAANWGDEFENLKFWDALDFIGLNCYYPLSKSDNPSKRELTNAFDKIMGKAAAVCKKYNKQLVFTEIGFRSVDRPWKNPHAKEDGRPFNEAHQQLCYEVVLKGIQNKKWCNGILWWKWPSYMSYRGHQNTGFSPNLKQTENVINKYFKTK
ncbi:MAG: hypothetical protein AB8G86_17040 [Saprospiraceae bacterium]